MSTSRARSYFEESADFLIPAFMTSSASCHPVLEPSDLGFSLSPVTRTRVPTFWSHLFQLCRTRHLQACAASCTLRFLAFPGIPWVRATGTLEEFGAKCLAYWSTGIPPSLPLMGGLSNDFMNHSDNLVRRVQKMDCAVQLGERLLRT